MTDDGTDYFEIPNNFVFVGGALLLFGLALECFVGGVFVYI